MRIYGCAFIVLCLMNNCVGMYKDPRVAALERKAAELAVREAVVSKREMEARKSREQTVSCERLAATLAEREASVRVRERKMRPKSPPPVDMSPLESRVRMERDWLERSEAESEKKLEQARAGLKKVRDEKEGITKSPYIRTYRGRVAYKSAILSEHYALCEVDQLDRNLRDTRKKIDAREETICESRRYAAYKKTPEYAAKEAQWAQEARDEQEAKNYAAERAIAEREAREREASDEIRSEEARRLEREASDEIRSEEARRLGEEERAREYERANPFGGETYDRD